MLKFLQYEDLDVMSGKVLPIIMLVQTLFKQMIKVQLKNGNFISSVQKN